MLRQSKEEILGWKPLYFESYRNHEFIETEEHEDIFAAMKQLYEDCITKRFTEREIGSENSMDITLEEVYNAMEDVRRDW